MSSGTELDELVTYFRTEGFHSERRQWSFGDSFLVAGQSEAASGMRVYKRSVYIRRSPAGAWVSLVVGIELSDIISVAELQEFVGTLMRSSDAEYQAEVSRRSRAAVANA